MPGTIADSVLSGFRRYYRQGKEGRFARLVLHTTQLRAFQPHLLEQLFFSGMVGSIGIDSVVPYILGIQDTQHGQYSLYSGRSDHIHICRWGGGTRGTDSVQYNSK